MTTLSTASPSVAIPSGRQSVRWAIDDALAIARRNLVMYVRVPQLMVFSTVQPVLFVLLFTYVFGGAIAGSGSRYVDYLLPGIMAQTVMFGSTQTGVGLANDLSKGIIDRFRSLPMARSAVLAGRTIADAVRNTFVVVIMIIVGYGVGFRFHAGPFAALGAIGIAVLFGFAFSWISTIIGLAVRDPEAAQAAGFIWVFPLVFASSVFVRIQTMPKWLQRFARVNPISNIVDAMRALSQGGPTTVKVLHAVIWLAVLLVVFMPVAVRQYRRIT